MKLRLSWCWKLTATLLCITLSTEGAIRCYCNRDECTDTHTCISVAEKCYSKLYTVYTHENQTAQASKDEHGCIDLIYSNSIDSTLCDSSGDVVKQLKEREPLIMCCSDNLCNYRKSQDIQVDIIDSTAIAKDEVKEEQIIPVEENSIAPVTGENDVIFRAAVIAVPIAGGLILVILILMAVRMLREDYRGTDRPHRLLKAHSFIEQHFVRKEDKKNVRSKKYYSNSIRDSGETPSVHHNTHSQLPGDQHTEHFIRHHTGGTNRRDDGKSSVCVSLLPNDKQSNVSLV